MSKENKIRERPLHGFLEFVRTQGVVGLAVGLVLGTATATLVNSLINNIVMPPLGFLLGSSNGLKGLALHIGTATGDQASMTINYGVFLNDFINFIVIALVVYVIVKKFNVEIKKK
ncbi:MAG: MscL family protein [Candidatus Nomurabacteria bacterium]|jgi:large conductance mechanosensitive channel|nr:MscL family protein [Candidatus Nomurabacteria bacterium]